jgi:hypothetical protein
MAPQRGTRRTTRWLGEPERAMVEPAEGLRQEVCRAMREEGPLLEVLKTQFERLREFLFAPRPELFEVERTPDW